jgi:hypothetical protein
LTLSQVFDVEEAAQEANRRGGRVYLRKEFKKIQNEAGVAVKPGRIRTPQ